jgi:urease accessory protein
VQRPFASEDGGACEVYVLHPPGGIAGGDELALRAALGPGARALLTTPAATKVYRSNGPRSLQVTRIRAGDGALIEWLPQETIVFDGADVTISTRIDLEGRAEALACEVLCLGRPAAGERFMHGRVELLLDVHRDDRPLLVERTRLRGGEAALQEPFGLDGNVVLGTLLSTGAKSEIVSLLRERIPPCKDGEFAVSRLYGALVCRYLGRRVEEAHEVLREALLLLREQLTGRTGALPRIWLT